MGKSIVLDLCGGTGAWSKPYKEAGYKVLVVTLPVYNACHVTYADNALLFFKSGGGFTAVKYGDITGILAAPPCTEFSLAKNTKQRDLAKGAVTVEACMRIIWEVQKRTKLDFWALENPRGLLRRFLGRPAYTFEQWQFGGELCKPTDIWGYFNPPTPPVKKKPEITKYICYGSAKTRKSTPVSYACPKTLPEYSEYLSQFRSREKCAAIRAITPAGFAEAFYRANRLKEDDR